ncbi:MAG: CbrC family protein [Candidatus Latescibacteria bacterium]|nr:CbrC family protein [Candidatus Latescibacterota bacterium]
MAGSDFVKEPGEGYLYHPDPVAAGSVEQSDAECVCCGRQRDYIIRRYLMVE